MSLQITGLNVSLNKKEILRDINLEIKPGCFLSLLGPSGCGKSTLLKTVCGFIPPDEGVIILDGKALNPISPHQRNVVMLFQDTRLFPHLNVIENVAFGLKMAAVNKKERVERASAMLAMVRLKGYEKKMPRQLSGGQQQRVALARALITTPAVLLLDEPFSGLDTSLRLEMRRLLSELHKQTQTSMVFVTHDYEEALSLSDAICVMDKGRILQAGSPREVYSAPACLSVARYFCQDNMIDGTVTGGIFRSPLFTIDMGAAIPDGYCTAALYPGAVAVDPSAPPDFEVADMAFMGDHFVIYARIGTHQLKIKAESSSNFNISDKVGIKINSQKIMLFRRED